MPALWQLSLTAILLWATFQWLSALCAIDCVRCFFHTHLYTRIFVRKRCVHVCVCFGGMSARGHPFCSWLECLRSFRMFQAVCVCVCECGVRVYQFIVEWVNVIFGSCFSVVCERFKRVRLCVCVSTAKCMCPVCCQIIFFHRFYLPSAQYTFYTKAFEFSCKTSIGCSTSSVCRSNFVRFIGEYRIT